MINSTRFNIYEKKHRMIMFQGAGRLLKFANTKCLALSVVWTGKQDRKEGIVLRDLVRLKALMPYNWLIAPQQ